MKVFLYFIGKPKDARANAMAEMKSLLKARKPLYMLADAVVDTSSASLEQAAGRKHLTIAADVYSLGVILY